jgi:hypothetical protein
VDNKFLMMSWCYDVLMMMKMPKSCSRDHKNDGNRPSARPFKKLKKKNGARHGRRELAERKVDKERYDAIALRNTCVMSFLKSEVQLGMARRVRA